MASEWLADLAERGSSDAIIERDIAISYEGLVDRIRGQMTAFLDAGIGRGDAVALHDDYGLESIAALFALAALGAIIVPVTNMTPTVAETLRSTCGAGFVCRPRSRPSLERWSAGASHPLYAELRARGAAGLVLLSSGSTGTPKAILHDLDALLQARRTTRANRRLRILLLLMFDHIGGINTLINTLFSGGTAVVVPERSPEAVCAAIATHGVQILPGNPTFLNLVLIGRFQERYDLSSLRLITYGTEPMPEQLLLRIHAAFPRARLLQTFGTSETGIANTQSASSESTQFKISDSDYEHRIVDGELQLRSRTQFLGYLNASDAAVTSDGWFRTGDLAERGEGGFLKILGRNKEVINVGGEKVLPLDIDSLLMEHTLVADCVAYGMPNAITGQAVCVDVVPSRDVDKSVLRREINEFLSGRVARYKMPSKIRLVDAIEASERFKKRRIRM